MENTRVTGLIPHGAHLYFPTGDQKKCGEGKKTLRWIFEGDTTFDDFENQSLDQLYEEMKRQGCTVPEEWRRSDSLKFLIACSFDMKKSINGIQEYIEWRKNTLPIEPTSTIMDYLNSGLLYMHGRDHRFRPLLYFNCYKIDTKTIDVDQLMLSMGYFLEYMIHNALLPGQVERWIFTLDLKGMSITSLPFGILKRVLGFLQNNFRSRLYKMYIMNSPTSIYFTWKMIKSLLEETTTQKINFSKESTNEDMWKHVNKSQVEEKFGGTAKNIEVDFWPPKVPSGDYLLTSDDPASLMIAKDEYQKKNQEGKLANYKVCKELIE